MTFPEHVQLMPTLKSITNKHVNTFLCKELQSQNNSLLNKATIYHKVNQLMHKLEVIMSGSKCN